MAARSGFPTIPENDAMSDLAGIRDDAELTRLPESERKAYLKPWADVDALLKNASGA